MTQKNIKNRFFLSAVLLFLAMAVFPMHAQAANRPISMSSCKLNAAASKLAVKAKVNQKTAAMGKRLYLIGLDAYASGSGKVGAVPLASVKAKKGTIRFSAPYDRSMLFQKFAAAYKKGKKYVIASDFRYITNPSVLASYTGDGPLVSSKKGMQAEDIDDFLPGSLDLGTQHILLNWTLSSLLNDKASNKVPFQYKGRTYELDENILKKNDALVQAYNAAGVRVTVILLLPQDAQSQAASDMKFDGGYSYTLYSSIKTSDRKGCEAFEAVMSFLAERYGNEKNLVSGWILGNEVNSACVWNYGGNKNLAIYMENYARAFRICYNAVKSCSANSNVYISLDYNWNTDADGGGKRYFSAKGTLDQFFVQLKAAGDIPFQIAYHAYPQGMTDPIFWDDTLAVNSIGAKIINFKNLKVLTDYAKKNFGEDCTIMLSEQSFNSTKGEAVQAAAYAYAYYISEGNSMVEAFIYGRGIDHPSETKMGYHWGLCDSMLRRRLIWHVFQYIDSQESFDFTNPLLQYTGLKKWSKIKGFKKSICTTMASKRAKVSITGIYSMSASSMKLAWNRIATADGYEIYRNGTLADTVSGSNAISYTDKDLNKGETYAYQIRMYKEAPDSGNPDKRRKLYGEMSDMVNATVTAGAPEFNKERCDVDGKAIKIAWRKMDDVDGFEVFRSDQADGIYTKIAQIPKDKSTYTDTNTISGRSYSYKVRAYVVLNGINYYSMDSEPIVLQALTQLAARIENGGVILSWEDWPDAARYRIFYKMKDQPDEAYIRITRVKENPYRMAQDTYHFAVGSTYCFRVRPVYANDDAAEFSNVAELFIDASINNPVVPEPPSPTEPAPSVTEQGARQMP